MEKEKEGKRKRRGEEGKEEEERRGKRKRRGEEGEGGEEERGKGEGGKRRRRNKSYCMYVNKSGLRFSLG